MNKFVSKLNKLQSMGLQEAVGRGRQEFHKLADRMLLPISGGKSEESLYKAFRPDQRNGSGEGSVALIGDRFRRAGVFPLPSLNDRAAIVSLINDRFPEHKQAILNEADNACTGTFDLLGYKGLNFGRPIDWHLDPLTFERAPMIHWSRIDSVAPIGKGDLKIFWEINRTAHFVTLGQAWWLTGDDRYVAEFVNQATAWIDANPYGMGIGWAASLDTAFRSIAWLWALSLCADSPLMTEHFLVRIIKALIEHGRHIEKYLSLYFSPNTHLTGEALGLFYLGLSLPELIHAERWRDLGLRILIEQLPRHVRNDGVYFEQSSYYHRYTMDFYLHLSVLLDAAGTTLSSDDRRLMTQKLEALGEHLMWIERPDGSWPLFGDDDGGRLIRFAPRAGNDFSDTLAIGAAIFERGDWKHGAGEAPPELLWFLGPEGLESYDRLQSKLPTATSRSFDESGFYVMRDGWDRQSSFVLIDCGRHGSEAGSGHAHSDALAFELALRGTTWLVDPATHVYGSQPELRNWFRSSEAHNTATVDGEGQSVPANPFAWNATAECSIDRFEDHDDSVIFVGSHDGYRRLSDPVFHERAIIMLRERSVFIVDDQFTAESRHTYSIRFHFTPESKTTVLDRGLRACMPDGSSLILQFFVAGDVLPPVRPRVERGWVSTIYGQRSEAEVVVLEIACNGAIRVTTLLFPESREIDAGNERPNDLRQGNLIRKTW